MTLTYEEVHLLLAEKRGPARFLPCAACGRVATVHEKNGCWWSYQFTGEMLRSPKGAPYSEDIWNDYAPNCNSCHNKMEWEFDRDRQLAINRPNVEKAGTVLLEKLKADPEFSKRFRAQARVSAARALQALNSKLESDPDFKERFQKTLSDNGKKVSQFLRQKLDSDPQFRAEHEARGRRMKDFQYLRQCNGCGRVFKPGALGQHQKHSGHIGYTQLGADV